MYFYEVNRLIFRESEVSLIEKFRVTIGDKFIVLAVHEQDVAFDVFDDFKDIHLIVLEERVYPEFLLIS